MITHPKDLGVFATDKQIFLFSNILGKNLLHVGVSTNGLNFQQYKKKPEITRLDGQQENISACEAFRISLVNDTYVLMYKKHVGHEMQTHIAFSKDGILWHKAQPLAAMHEAAMIAPQFSYKNASVAFSGTGEIHMAISHDLLHWEKDPAPVLTPRHKFFDNHALEFGSVITVKKGLVVVYFVKIQRRDGNHYAVGAALLDKRNPKHVLWRTDKPIWEQNTHWHGKDVYPMGAVHFKDRFIVYFGIPGEGVYAVSFDSLNDILEDKPLHPHPKLEKHPGNPIITPVLKHVWEASSTFNAAAIHEGGKVHILYRAMGPHNTSVIGYAASSDGITIDERLPEPIYEPTEPFEYPGKNPHVHFMSGGGYGGCEDPRVTKIDDMIYMTYVAYNGVDHPRVALTSIKTEDFMKRRWNWAKPILISRPGVVNKNCVLFPEKINGNYVVIHRVFPNMLIDFVDDLTFEERYLEGKYSIPPREDSWDSRKLGAGAPPLKTKEGWLMIYQAVDDKDPGRYKIGAMLLDLKDPTKVLYRATTPVLEPTEWYENEGFKAGVAYPCGAVIMNDRLLVYYGGADTVICAASAPLDTFLEQLKKSSPVQKRKKTVAPQMVQAYSYAST